MSFLDRFQDKISTITSQGHLRNSDGTEEVRVGLRRPKKTPNRPKKLATCNQSEHLQTSTNRFQENPQRDSRKARQTVAEVAPKQPKKPGKIKKFREMSYHKKENDDVLPQELNESKVQSEDDRIAFSKKSHRVDYEPCKLSEYKKENSAGYFELGKLQPDLNSDELVLKRANQDRIKAFSMKCREINQSQNQCQIKKKKNETPESKIPSTREKALLFAKNVPKPKIIKEKQSKLGEIKQTSGIPGGLKTDESKLYRSKEKHEVLLPFPNKELSCQEDLIALQRKHRESCLQVDAIRRELNY